MAPAAAKARGPKPGTPTSCGWGSVLLPRVGLRREWQGQATPSSYSQVLVVCGRNAALVRRLQAAPSPPHVKLHVYGFVDNMHQLMAASDAIITKAGPGTIAESLVSGLPILLSGNIPCQEEGNIPYVVENKVGAFETRAEKIAALVNEWLGPGAQERLEMSRRSKALGRPEALYRIVSDLEALMKKPEADGFSYVGPPELQPAFA